MWAKWAGQAGHYDKNGLRLRSFEFGPGETDCPGRPLVGLPVEQPGVVFAGESPLNETIGAQQRELLGLGGRQRFGLNTLKKDFHRVGLLIDRRFEATGLSLEYQHRRLCLCFLPVTQ